MDRWIQINGKWQIVEETRTPEQIARDREASTIAAKIRVNAAMGVDSPNMKARLAELAH
jgi:hypothetical protein